MCLPTHPPTTSPYYTNKQNGISALLFLGHGGLFLWLALGKGLTNLKLYAYEAEGYVYVCFWLWW